MPKVNQFKLASTILIILEEDHGITKMHPQQARAVFEAAEAIAEAMERDHDSDDAEKPATVDENAKLRGGLRGIKRLAEHLTHAPPLRVRDLICEMVDELLKPAA